jgi:hypothetical protein
MMATTRSGATPDLCATRRQRCDRTPGRRADARATDEHQRLEW